MALTTKKKTRILFYLGYPGLTIVENSTSYSGIISDRIDAAGDTPEICCIVEELLRKLSNLDDRLEKAQCRLSASKIDNLTLNDDEIRHLNRERKRCIRELSQLIDIPDRSRGMSNGVCN